VYSEFGFLNHSLVGFDNAPDYDREDCGYSVTVWLGICTRE